MESEKTASKKPSINKSNVEAVKQWVHTHVVRPDGSLRIIATKTPPNSK